MTGSCADGPSSVAAAFNCNMHRAARLLAPVRYAAERSVDPRRYDALPMVRSLHRRLLKETRWMANWIMLRRALVRARYTWEG